MEKGSEKWESMKGKGEDDKGSMGGCQDGGGKRGHDVVGFWNGCCVSWSEIIYNIWIVLKIQKNEIHPGFQKI